MSAKYRAFLLFLGDALIMAVSLGIALLIRHGSGFTWILFQNHLKPFSLIFAIWFIVFYIAGLYEFRNLKNNLNFTKKFGASLLINTVIAIMFFYLFPIFGIAPKTNLFLFVAIFAILDWPWRYFFNFFAVSLGASAKVLLIGASPDIETTINYLTANPQLGWEIKTWIKNPEIENNNEINQIIKTNKINTVVLLSELKQNKSLIKTIYQNLTSGIEVLDFNIFYQNIFKKVPLQEIQESWLLENITKKQRAYDIVKSFLDFVLALLLLIISSPIFLIVFLLVKTTSAGPTIYKQARIGRNGKQFTLYKFRTMINEAEKNGPQWSQSNDPRITKIGKFLRFTHLDEIPQLINILKGGLSFVGPRPERPEFVKELKEKIPYYEIRSIIKPGFTGWAQVNYRYGASLEDAYEKLQYDIYYLKNRSLVFDLMIIIKTGKLLFGGPR